VKSFFKGFFSSLLALFVFFGLVFLIFFGVLGAILATDKVEIDPKSVLVLDLGDSYSDRKKNDPFEEFTQDETKPDLYTVLKLIKHAQEDTLVKGIYLRLNSNGNGFAASQELKKSLTAFKSKGKFIYAFGDYIDQRAYHLASLSDKIYCHPQGAVEWQGMSVEYVFFKEMIDRLEIKPQIFYAGKFKSATEPFRESKMTDANKEQTSVWLNDLYDEMVGQVADERNLPQDSLRAWAATYKVSRPEAALRMKLIDGLRYDDEVKDEIRKKLSIGTTEKINFISLAKYAKAVNLSEKYSSDKIALVVAEGEIVYGKGTPDDIGSDEYLSLLRKIRSDRSVKAVVLRVNSPGGSSLASEIIWREIELMKKAGKKVVVSMGNVAASGGYYISCNAQKIFVEPGTITGSIGVFSVIPDFSSFMKNKLGVSFDRVKTADMADAPSVTRPMSDAEKTIVQQEVDRIYDTFKQRVADGRKLKMAYVDSIAQGRVWTGKRAIKLGLADAEGGIQEAIDEAIKMTGLKEFKLKVYPEPKSILEYITEQYPSEFVSSKMEKELGKEEYLIYKKIRDMKSATGEIKAMLPYTFNIY
jgi:protease-4